MQDFEKGKLKKFVGKKKVLLNIVSLQTIFGQNDYVTMGACFAKLSSTVNPCGKK